MPYNLINAALEWDATGRPRSVTYGDIYDSRADALGESTHVFLQGNRLAERWRELRATPFTVGELGFGAGLNVLNACRLWCAAAPAGSVLPAGACLHQSRSALRKFSPAPKPSSPMTKCRERSLLQRSVRSLPCRNTCELSPSASALE